MNIFHSKDTFSLSRKFSYVRVKHVKFTGNPVKKIYLPIITGKNTKNRKNLETQNTFPKKHFSKKKMYKNQLFQNFKKSYNFRKYLLPKYVITKF